MSTPKHSAHGAMSPSDPKFIEHIMEAQHQLMGAVTVFEAATGRTVDALSLQWLDVTTMADPEPRHLRVAHVSWLPMPGEFD